METPMFLGIIKEYWFTILTLYATIFIFILSFNLVRETLLWGSGSLLKHYFWVSFCLATIPRFTAWFVLAVAFLAWVYLEAKRQG